ncbi:hypothetical protein HOD08_05155, partial [bacterium]|nr:hypothetical protein [bacterium]
TINLLDQLNALHLEITEEAIIEALGCVSDKDFLEIGTLLVEQKSNELLVFLEKIRASRFSPQHLWTKSIEFFRILMRAKLLGAKNIFWGTYEKEKILELAQQCSIERINAIVHLLWGQEEIFLRTSKKDIFVEHLMLQICSQVNVEPLAKIIEAIESGGHSKTTRTPPPREEPARSFTPPPPRQQFVPPASTTPAPVEKENSAPAAPLDQTPTNISPIDSSPIQSSAENQLPQEWTKFLAELPPLGDNLVHTGLQKALRLENANGKTTIFFDQLNPFLVSHLEETKKRWLPILQNHIADIKDIDFKGGVTAEQKREEIPQLNATTQRRSTWRPAQGLVDVSDKEKWPKAQILLKHFPGRLTETQ